MVVVGGVKVCEHKLRGRGTKMKQKKQKQIILFVQKTNRSKQSSKCRKSHFMHSK